MSKTAARGRVKAEHMACACISISGHYNASEQSGTHSWGYYGLDNVYEVPDRISDIK
jgi:hypothetical protein